MGWKAVHTDGREIERSSRQDVTDDMVRQGENPDDWTFSMTRIRPRTGGYVDGRPQSQILKEYGAPAQE